MPFPKNPNKIQKPQKTGVKRAVQLNAQIERLLKKCPSECKALVIELTRASLVEFEAGPAVAAPAAEVSTEF